MGCRTCTNYSNKLNYCSYMNDYLSIFDDLDKGCEVYENCKEPTAEEMFEKLGYKKEKLLYGLPRFTNLEKDIWIRFHDNKTITFVGHSQIDMYELQAINQKCKELGWL